MTETTTETMIKPEVLTPAEAIGRANNETVGQNPDRPLPTKREWLAGLNPPLAKSVAQAQAEGKRGGGRLSKAAHERVALELANPAGQRFAD